MNTTISIILNAIWIVISLYALAILSVFIIKFTIFKYETIKIIISRNKRLKHFRFLIQNHQNDLKPLLEDLDQMINKLISVDLTMAEINVILGRYHFYKDILDKISERQKVKKIDLIEFARLHKEYCDILKDFKRMNNNKFYEENKFFDINLN